jgi:hypothetical protein
MHSTQFCAGRRGVSIADAESRMRALVGALRGCLGTELSADADFGQRETRALAVLNEAVRRLLETDLQRMADAQRDEVIVEGHLYRRHQPGGDIYHSLCGSLCVRRWTYRRTDVRNGPTVVPLEHAAGLMHGATPALAYSVALGFANGPLRHYERAMEAAHRRIPSRSTLERLGKTLGTWMKNDIADLEPVLRGEEELPPGAHVIVAGLDRTTVPHAEPIDDLDDPPRSRKRKRPYVRRPPAPVEVKYRMAYVGTVSVVNRAGDTLITRRYAATAEERADDILARMTLDIAALRHQKPALPLLIIQDGAPELWNLMREAFRLANVGPWEELIDRYHANEHLGRILELLEPDAARRRERYAQWQSELDTKGGAMKRIAADLWAEIFERGKQSNDEIHMHQGYLESYADAGPRRGMMCYAHFRQRNFPVGSGVTEGACKSLITMRAKRSGQRWSSDGVSAALTLRALEQSDRFDRAWELFQVRYSLPMQWN